MNKKVKKGISAAVICAMMLTTAATALNVGAYADSTSVSATASQSYSIKKKNVTMYKGSAQDKSKAALYFVNGTEIPYMAVSDYFDLLKDTYHNLGLKEYDVKIKANGNKLTLTRETKYSCVIDFADDTEFFKDYNEFNRRRKSSTLIDIMNIPEKDESGKAFF